MTEDTKGWRDAVKVHPAADLFPMLDREELAELAVDIAQNGLQVPLAWYIDQDGDEWLLDGRNRLAALEMNGADIAACIGRGKHYAGPDEDPAAIVIALNIHRRHLTNAQKREVIAKLLQAGPERSNRDLARMIHVDDKTVGAERARQEELGAIPEIAKTVGRDGRARTTAPRRTAPTKPAAREPLTVEEREKLIDEHAHSLGLVSPFLALREARQEVEALRRELASALGVIKILRAGKTAAPEALADDDDKPASGRRGKYRFDRLEVGESVIVDGPTNSIRSAAWQYGSRHDKLFAVHQKDDGIHVTRTA